MIRSWIRAVAVLLILAGACFAAEGDAAHLVDELREVSGMQRGLCCMLGTHDGTLPQVLVRRSGLLVHVIEPDAAKVSAARKRVAAGGLWLRRVVVEQGGFRTLPYAENTVDLLVAVRLTDKTLANYSQAEILRVLRPGGRAILGNSSWEPGELTPEKLEAWMDKAQRREPPAEKPYFLLRRWIKPRPTNTDQWTHWEHAPDNNPVSTDEVIKAPYLTQWMGGPYYIAMPAITVSAGGRLFLATGHIAHHRREWGLINTLIARNSFNGIELWRRRLPAGYMVHRSAFIASETTLYVLEREHCLLLDARTGRKTGTIRIPKLDEPWEWMAMLDGTLYVLSGPGSTAKVTKRTRQQGHWSWGDLSPGYYGKQVGWGFGHTITALDMITKRIRWQHREKQPIDSRAMVLGGGRAFFYAPGSRIGCIDTAGGELLWTHEDAETFGLIEQKGRGLISTPGFRSCCYTIYTPKAVVFQAQTRMNVVAVSTEDGRKLWHRRKVTNNPTMIHVDGQLIMGTGRRGDHQAVDPASGEVLAEMPFRKRSCARLTGCPDAFFCRGEGLLRYDRKSKQATFNAAFRPACNDGALPIDGLLHIPPWLCDCNLSLMGSLSLCPAGHFRFDQVATEAKNLQRAADAALSRKQLTADEKDWVTYRASASRGAATQAALPAAFKDAWDFEPDFGFLPAPPTAVGERVFVAGDDGKVRAIDADSGAQRWCFLTTGAIRQSPTFADGRLYVGSGDGFIYCIEAASGQLLWRFRAAPVERRIMIHDALASTWPVNTGVLVAGGVAYAAAGIIDYDGTYLYALDAATGGIRWQNNRSGHLNPALRKGASAQGVMTLLGDRLLMAGGNQVNPVVYERRTGKCLSRPPINGLPAANRGQEMGVFREKYVIFGGRLLYSAARRVVSPAGFGIRTDQKQMRLVNGRTPPAWDGETFAMTRRPNELICCTADGAEAAFVRKYERPPRARRWWQPMLANGVAAKDVLWRAGLDAGSEIVSLALAADAVVFIDGSPHDRQNRRTWTLRVRDRTSGKLRWKKVLPAAPLPGGLAITRGGQIVVATLDGRLLCFGKADAQAAPGGGGS